LGELKSKLTQENQKSDDYESEIVRLETQLKSCQEEISENLFEFKH